jgi:flavin-dependent dehydrogenase
MLRVAIIGSGPAGAALATLLARAGAAVTLLDDGKRPALLVGESLVPAVVPILQRLGIERDVAAIGCVKPGALFEWSPRVRFEFNFARFAPTVPPYAYNVARPRFDEVLTQRALAAGVVRAQVRARIERTSGAAPTQIALTPETLAAAPSLDGRQPDLIVDASGRARCIARTLEIPARVGARDDVAHFAHFRDVHWPYPPGQIVVTRLAAGWSWCIPLKDRLSIGIVVSRERWASLGRTAADRLDRAIAEEPNLARIRAHGARISPVATYTNYQLVSARAHGRGWVAIGDAFGFVDPMLSPGVYLSLRSAELVAAALAPLIERPNTASPEALANALTRYAAQQTAALEAWMELIGYFYDGRLPAMVDAGQGWMATGTNRFKRRLQNHIERHMALLACGIGTTSRYSRGLLRLLGRYGLRGVAPGDLAIR